MITNTRRWALPGLLLAGLLLTACSEKSGSGIISASGGRHGGHSIAPPTTSQPPAPVDVPTETHTGKGAGGFKTSWPAGTAGYLTFDCPRCSDNVIVESDGDDSLLVNGIGHYHGTSWFNVSPGKPASAFVVRADGAWTATLADRRSLQVAEAGKTVTGKGNTVLALPAGVTKLAVTAGTKGNFAVEVTGATYPYPDLAVNQIGNYSGTINVRSPAVLQISDDDSWTLTAS